MAAHAQGHSMIDDRHRSKAGSQGECRRSTQKLILLFCLSTCIAVVSASTAQPADPPAAAISKAASEACARKIRALEAFANAPGKPGARKTRFTQAEINSYLALELKPKYHPSLQNLELAFEEDKVRAVASIDFDKLSMNSTKMLTRLVAKLFSAKHSLSMSGTLAAKEGMANFILDEARFDDTSLPNFLVEEIISAVGRKQKPPFDPLQPSRMPYAIDRVEVHRESILVCQ
jgi:hypothetical protein